MMIGGLGDQLADCEREIAEKDVLLAAKDREIAQLRNDLAWERAARKQLESVAAPFAEATVVRPDGESAEIVHAVARESQEIAPPLKYGRPDYPAWAKLVKDRVATLSAPERRWLLTDNAAHFHDYEVSFPWAGIALEHRVKLRIAELEASAVNP
jgi:hypothetical protein